MLPYIRNGNLGLLKKCSLATFWKEFSESEVTEVQRNLFKDDVELGIDELIKNCPHITHLDDYTDHYEDPSYFKRGALKIFSTYGPQLKHFQCNVNSPEIAHAILEKCKNMESLDLDFLYHCNWDQSAVTIDSNLAEFGHLEKLTEVDLRLINSAEIVTEFIKRRGMNLQSFKLDFGGSDSYKIMFAICFCKNLKNLKLDIYDNIIMCEEKEEEAQEKISETRGSADAILEECPNLRTVDIHVRVYVDSCEGEMSIVNLLVI